MDKNSTILNQTEVFGHQDDRLLFIIGMDDNKNTMINCCDIRNSPSVLLGISKPIQNMTEEEILLESRRLKDVSLSTMNGYEVCH